MKYCAKCDKRFEKGAVNLLLECEVCNTAFTFVCRLCNRHFPNRCKAYTHIRTVCEPLTYNCNDCDFSTKHRERIKFHIYSKHFTEPIKFIQCNECCETISTAVFKYHQKHCDKAKQFECLFCPFKTPDRSGLRLHLKLHGVNSSMNINFNNTSTVELDDNDCHDPL